jgi:hypothetical protein
VAKALLQCRSLSALRVRLDSVYTPQTADQKAGVLEELLAFENLDIFEVRVLWDTVSTASCMKSKTI